MKDYKFKTEPFKHQEERFYLYRDRENHAHLWEQRCGKSKITIDTSAWLYGKGAITGMLVLAPCGVHLNWTKNEIPIHMPDYVGADAVAYVSGPNASQRKDMERFWHSTGGLKIMSMNIEAVNTPTGLATVQQFLRSFRTMLVLDEGSVIKNMEAQRTKKLLKIAPHAAYRRVLNGTPVTQCPFDIYPQFTMLDDYILGPSYIAFKNKYAIWETQGRMPGEIKSRIGTIADRLGTFPWGEFIMSEENGAVTSGQWQFDDERKIEFTIKQIGRTFFDMRWKVKDPYRPAVVKEGSEKLQFEPGQVYKVVKEYRNLDILQKKIAPYSDRVLKADCLDLPEKIYQKRYVELSKKQRQMYEELKKQSLTEHRGQQMSVNNALVKLLRQQQIVGGFFTPDLEIPQYQDGMMLFDFEEELVGRIDRTAQPIEEHCPRIEELVNDIDQFMAGSKVLIWARFSAEIKIIAEQLRKRFGRDTVREAYGAINADVRQRSIDEFQNCENPRFLVANPQCKGVSRGQNLCKAAFQIYYSNSFSLEDRLQSEDRPHSPGQTVNLAVIDFVAPDTCDEKVIDALRSKKDIADLVTGDKIQEWI